MQKLDVCNLHPSISQEYLMQQLGTIILRYIAGRKTAFLLWLIPILLDACTVEYRSSIYSNQTGIPTGFGAGVIIADVYMACLNLYGLANLNAEW